MGEDSIEAAIRGVKEELGIDIDRVNARYIGSALRYYQGCPGILDVCLFKSNVLIDDVKIQKEEVNDAKWLNRTEIMKLYDDNKFDANAYF